MASPGFTHVPVAQLLPLVGVNTHPTGIESSQVVVRFSPSVLLMRSLRSGNVSVYMPSASDVSAKQ